MYGRKLQELYEKRAGIIVEARRCNDANDLDGYNKAVDDVDKIDAEIAKLEEAKKKEERTILREVNSPAPAAGAPPASDAERRNSPEYRNDVYMALRHRNNPSAAEYRTLRVGVDYQGGYLLMPETFDKQLLQVARDVIGVRSQSRVIPVTTAGLAGVNVTVHMSSVVWGNAELSAGSLANIPQLEKRLLTPHSMRFYALVSNDLLDLDAVVDPMAFIEEQLIQTALQEEETAFLTGDGIGKPLGLLTPSPKGVPTSQDVDTLAAAEISGDDLINLQYALRGVYGAKAQFAMHRLVWREVMKLKNDGGDYLWLPSLRVGQPDMLLGKPSLLLEKMPSTTTSGTYAVLYGDFSQYHIADGPGSAIKIEPHYFFNVDKTAIQLRRFVDAHAALGEAFVRLKIT